VFADPLGRCVAHQHIIANKLYEIYFGIKKAQDSRMFRAMMKHYGNPSLRIAYWSPFTDDYSDETWY
jgi:hypothetical protein